MTMENFSGKFDFLKLKNACVISVNGKSGAKKGVFIPIEDNNLFVSTDENNKAKGAYFNFAVFENKQPTKFGDTHMIKPNLDKETRTSMSEEERRAVPIIGSMKPFEIQHSSQTVEAQTVDTSNNDVDDLPF